MIVFVAVRSAANLNFAFCVKDYFKTKYYLGLRVLILYKKKIIFCILDSKRNLKDN